MTGLEGTLVLVSGIAASAIVPFVPSVSELFHQRDAGELHIAQDYVKDPRFFATSFRKKIEPLIAERETGPLPFKGQIKLRKPENLTIDRELTLTRKTGFQGIAVSLGDARFDADSGSHDVWIKGAASIGDRYRVWTLAVDGELTMGDKCRITRWVDCSTSAVIGNDCDLGQSASSVQMLMLKSGVKFQRLYAQPIVVEWSADEVAEREPMNPLIDDDAFTDHDGLCFPHDSTIDNDIVCAGDLRLGRRMVVRGNVKAHGTIKVLNDARIEGNLISRTSIEIGDDVTIMGNIFAEGDVTLGRGVTVGTPEMHKSVYSAGRMVIHRGVSVHGAIIAERGGVVESMTIHEGTAKPAETSAAGTESRVAKAFETKARVAKARIALHAVAEAPPIVAAPSIAEEQAAEAPPSAELPSAGDPGHFRRHAFAERVLVTLPSLDLPELVLPEAVPPEVEAVADDVPVLVRSTALAIPTPQVLAVAAPIPQRSGDRARMRNLRGAVIGGGSLIGAGVALCLWHRWKSR